MLLSESMIPAAWETRTSSFLKTIILVNSVVQ
jgi:hypothetical protein